MKQLFKNKYLILIPILILYSISLFTMYNFTEYFNKQLFIISLSIIIFIISLKINIKYILKYHYIIYIISIILLILTLLIGKEVNNSKAWLDLGVLSFQPSELTKLSLLLTLSILTIKKKNILYLILLTLIPSILTYLEPDTGAIIIYLIILITCILSYKINKKTIIILSIIIILSLSTVIYMFNNHQDKLINILGSSIIYRLDRLTNYNDVDNIQINNSLIAISTNEHIYYPEAHNDFIFSLIISNYPLLLPIILIAYILIYLYYIFHSTHHHKLISLINKIILYQLFIQITINIFMNLNLIPVIGLPLPFLSYGGSYNLILATTIGLSINLETNYNKNMMLNYYNY